jgi:hypothetical protein
VKTLVVRAGINLENITRLNHSFGVGDAMYSFMINAGTESGGKALIPFETRNCAHFPDALFGINI